MKMIELYSGKVFGAISGLDRIRFRGTLRWLANELGMRTFLGEIGVLLKDFGRWAEDRTGEIRRSCEEVAEKKGIPMIYLQGSSVDKEMQARKVADERGVSDGPICMFSVVEPCVSPWVQGDRTTKKLELRMRHRKCVWIYYYFDHPECGFGHVRLQSWLPMNVNICLNGRHWLEKQLRRMGVPHVKDGNCFPWIGDIALAQRIMDAQLRTKWDTVLTGLTLEMCPSLVKAIHPLVPRYYWSADETEWATDVMFRSADELNAIYPQLIRHGMVVADSPAVMRFLGRRDTAGFGSGRMPEEIVSDSRTRYEGIRNKHWINQNSVKMYNKCGSVLRFETTINNTRDFKVYRRPEDDPKKPRSWQKMRKGVSDLHRRCEVSGQCNERYADAVCSLQISETLHSAVGQMCNPVEKEGKRYRGLNPWNREDLKMLEFLARGELAINGFRNHDLRNWMHDGSEDPADDKERKRLSGKTSRRIRLLRAHGLIRKVSRVNRYVLTEKGHKTVGALKCASAVDVKKLMDMAA
jgi:hypothetical protein